MHQIQIILNPGFNVLKCIFFRPIVEEYYTWLQSIFKPAGKLKKAITYSLNQREYLCAFLDYGEIEISNNQVENAIRPALVGRRDWLFCDAQIGANDNVIDLPINT